MKNSSIPEVKEIFLKNEGMPLEVCLQTAGTFVIEPDYELDSSIYEEEGIWVCKIVRAIEGDHPKFHKLFKPEGLLDIVENDVMSIGRKNSEVLYQKT